MIGKRILLVVSVALGLTLVGQESLRRSDWLITDGETGLTWVSDAGYAASSGFASDPVLTLPDALRFLAAMNAGEVENFGFTDWRLPTDYELAGISAAEAAGKLGQPVANISMARTFMDRSGRWSRRSARGTPQTVGVFTWPVRGAEVQPGFADVVVFATNSIDINNGAVILSGDLVANAASPGPTLNASVELSIGKVEVTTTTYSPGFDLVTTATARLKADSIKIHQQATVNGDVSYNDLQNNGTINGMLITPLALPVFSLLPPFPTAVPPPGAPDVTVPAAGSATLAAGDYGNIVVGDGATLTFMGGVYNVRNIAAGIGARLDFLAAAQVRVQNRFSTLQNSRVGSAAGAGVLAREVIFFVGGINGTTGALGDEPRAADIGRLNVVGANFYVPNGTIRMRRDTMATGAFMARDVLVENSCRLTRDNFFTNAPPEPVDDNIIVGEGQMVLVDVLANDTDPNNDNLSATPIPGNGPFHGTVVLDTPPGTFLYTHDGSETTSDTFDYEVCDDGSPVRCATATVFVTVAPSNDPPIAMDDYVTVPEGSFTASAFSVLDNDTDEENNALFVRSTGLFRTAHGEVFFNSDGTFTYSHDGSENFSDSAGYEVCETGPELPGCDTATLLISITPVNDPPTANAQTVQLPSQIAGEDGGTPSNSVDVVLTASDPDSGSLLFSIATGPSNGTLGPVVPIDATSASVTYTSNDPALGDSFVFEVDDQQGGTDTAQVTVNASPDVPIGTVAANDRSAEVNQNTPTAIVITGNAPETVALSFTVVSGPANGSLSGLTPGSEVPQRSASVTYIPANDYRGPDSFTFEACGDINSTTVCDQGVVSITVLGTLAASQEIRTFNDLPLQIDLSGEPVPTEGPGEDTTPPPDPRTLVRPGTGGLRQAVTLIPASVAGAVSDADENGIGDEANALPGPVPVLASAAVNSSGGAGVNGTVRFHMEFDYTAIPNPLGAGDRVFVNITTNRGTTDILDTFFYAGANNGDGMLTASDFQNGDCAVATQFDPPCLSPIPGAVLPVTGTQGVDATFLLDVTARVREIQAGGIVYEFFVVQGRVDESLAAGTSPMRGLQIRTSADGNVTAGTQPHLQIQQAEYRITALPTNGVLRDSMQNLVVLNQALPSRVVTYTPNPGYLGPDGFSFQGTLNQRVEIGQITLQVVQGTCEDNVAFCSDGRPAN